MSFSFSPLEISDVLLIEPKVFRDLRGYFMEFYRIDEFALGGIQYKFVQDNQSGSRQGTLRGLHYQIRCAQGKLVKVIEGEIFDVAVDLRKQSSTFGKWVGSVLSSSNYQMVWIPPGFAHGFYVLSSWAEVIYKTTDFYSPEWERILIWNDPAIGIKWPISQAETPLLSVKDSQGKLLEQADLFD